MHPVLGAGRLSHGPHPRRVHDPRDRRGPVRSTTASLRRRGWLDAADRLDLAGGDRRWSDRRTARSPRGSTSSTTQRFGDRCRSPSHRAQWQEHHRRHRGRIRRDRPRQAALRVHARSPAIATLLAIPVATAIGRVGCFLSELPLGTPTTLPWGVIGQPRGSSGLRRLPRLRRYRCTHRCCTRSLFNLVAIGVIVRYRDRVPIPGDALKLYLLAGCDLPVPRRVRPRQRAAGSRPDADRNGC